VHTLLCMQCVNSSSNKCSCSCSAIVSPLYCSTSSSTAAVVAVGATSQHGAATSSAHTWITLWHALICALLIPVLRHPAYITHTHTLLNSPLCVSRIVAVVGAVACALCLLRGRITESKHSLLRSDSVQHYTTAINVHCYLPVPYVR
jgi:hypothetical protein